VNQLCIKEAFNGPQTTLQGKAGCLMTVMDNWVQIHTIATLIIKVCQALPQTFQSYVES